MSVELPAAVVSTETIEATLRRFLAGHRTERAVAALGKSEATARAKDQLTAVATSATQRTW